MDTLLVELGFLTAWTRTLQVLGERLGPHRAGLLLGLPSTTAVALMACGYESGPEAARSMASASVLGLIPAASLPLTCAAAIGRGCRLPSALGLALVVYGSFAMALGQLPSIGAAGGAALAAFTLLALASTSRAQPERCETVAAQAQGIARSHPVLIPAACLLMVTALRESAGAAWAGLLAPFPGATLALLASTYAAAGPRAARRLASAAPRGALGTLAFLTVFVGLGPQVGPAWSIVAGYAAALLVLGMIAATTRSQVARPTDTRTGSVALARERLQVLRSDRAGGRQAPRYVVGRRSGMPFAPRFEVVGA